MVNARRIPLLVTILLATGACSGTSGASSTPTVTAVDSAVPETEVPDTAPTGDAEPADAEGQPPTDEREPTTADTGTPSAPDSGQGTGSTPISCTPAPDSTTTVAFLPPWSDTNARELELTIAKSDSRRPNPDDATTTPIQLTIEAAPAGGWTYAWDAGASVPADTGLPPEQLEDLLNDLPRQQIRYRQDEDRTELTFTNVDEMREAGDKTLELLGEQYVDPDTATATRQMFDNMSDDQFLQVFTKEPDAYHSFDGVELGIDENVTGPVLLPNAFGGPPFPSIITMQIKALVDEDGCVLIEADARFDGDKAAEVIDETIRSLAPEDATPAELSEAEESLDVRATTIAQYDVESGFFRRVTATRFFAVGGVERVDTRTITDVTPG